MYRIINIGSCRQDTLEKRFRTFNVNKFISYPHSTKEILEVIKFCKFGHLTPEETKYTFRTGLLNKEPIIYRNRLTENFDMGNVYVLEITSNKVFLYDNKYLHHIVTYATDDENVKNNVKILFQTKDEIETDIIEIKKLLEKPIVIISHLVTSSEGRRYELSEWLRDICQRHNIIYINPVEEFIKNNVSLKHAFEPETKLAHYTNYGHSKISSIYYNIISKIKIN